MAFEAPTATTTAERPAPRRETGRFDLAVLRLHTRARAQLPADPPARPPFPVRWAVRGNDLLEFGPVAGGSSLYLLKNNGAVYAIKRRTGVVFWKEKVGQLAASSPAYWDGLVICTLLQGVKGSRNGRIVAFNVE